MTGSAWLVPALAAAVLWGIVGVLQKLGSSRIGAGSLLIWVTAGYLVSLPLLLWRGGMGNLTGKAALIGVAAGLVNGLGAWLLFAALERGAKASVAIPLTALYPAVTIALAVALLQEKLSGREWLGVALALCGGVLLSYEREAPAEKEARGAASGQAPR